MTSEGNKTDVPNEPLSVEQPSSSVAKRKRGRPRKYEYTVYEPPQTAQPIQSIPPLRSTLDVSNIRNDGVQVNHTSVGSGDPKMCTIQALPAQQAQGNSAKDVIIGKHFVGKMAKICPGFSLITVKVKDNQVLKGWVPDENNLRPITLKDDLAPELPMLRPSQVRKRASAIHRQGALPMPVHLEDVTIAKPLQMRRPVEEYIAKHTIPPVPRPYMGSGIVAAAPVSVSSGNAESRILPKQDTESMCPESSADVVPVKSVQPVLISCKQVANVDVLVEGKSVTEVLKVSESSNGRKESSGERKLLNVPVMDSVKESACQFRLVDPTVMDEIKIASGPREQSNAANSKQQMFKEPSDNKEQSEQPKTETDILKGVDGSKSGASDDVQSVHDKHEMKAQVEKAT